MTSKHAFVIGDCLKILKTIPDESVDLIFADPPYGLAKKKGLGWNYSKHITLQEAWDIFSKDDFFEFNIQWLSECLRILKKGGSFWVCGSFHNIYQIGFILQHLDVKINNSIVWFKPNAQPNISCRMFTESTEHLIWAVKKDPKSKWIFNYDLIKQLNNGKQMRNMWEIPVTSISEKTEGEHPTQKPFELLKRIILACTKEGDIVLDPFVGSGTTSVVAKFYNRNSIGIEKEKKYLQIIKKRMAPSQKTIFDHEIEILYFKNNSKKLPDNFKDFFLKI
jgi:site-specific DNA-methyltransferase (adenine-specific)